VSVDLSVIIANWNTRELLAGCLESVRENVSTFERSNVETFVVDNASADGSAAMVRERFPWVRLIENAENVGFARANNQAIRLATGRYLLLLNSDTVLHPGALAALTGFMETHPGAGAAGGRLLNPDGSLQESCTPMLTPEREFWRLLFLDPLWPRASYSMRRWHTASPRPVEVIKGACLLLRRQALDEVGLLDESYFLYTEEVDLCYRLAQAGWTCWWAPAAVVTHYGAASTRQVAEAMYVQLYRSKAQFYRKFGGAARARRFKRYLAIAYWPRRVVAALLAPVSSPLAELAPCYRRLLRELPALDTPPEAQPGSQLASGSTMPRKPLPSLMWTHMAVQECLRDLIGVRHPARAAHTHLAATMAWLALAQDNAANDGVSAGFSRLGWLPDYPETTGYIIPTCLAYARFSGDRAYSDRARRMGDYALGVQSPAGAIPGGFHHPRRPFVFDTGQVIAGWVALFTETGDERYLAAARSAGDWLLAQQASDGSWPHRDHAGSPRTYHAMVAWALASLGQACGASRFTDAARRHVAWVLANQTDGGWFARAELRGQSFPVTHTIAYTVAGVLETGVLLGEDHFIAAARRTADALCDRQLADGSLYGAYAAGWQPKARWRCLTGCAQVSVVWLRLYALTGDARYYAAARGINDFLRRTQDLEAANASKRGAVKGSWPFYGAYERLNYPNWAAKFFADALMLEIELAPQASVSSQYRKGRYVTLSGSSP
jgi:GT2 family glycosyltransferase